TFVCSPPASGCRPCRSEATTRTRLPGNSCCRPRTGCFTSPSVGGRAKVVGVLESVRAAPLAPASGARGFPDSLLFPPAPPAAPTPGAALGSRQEQAFAGCANECHGGVQHQHAHTDNRPGPPAL